MGVVADVQDYLAAQSIVDGATGWPSARRRMHDGDGDKLVVITEDGGPEPEMAATVGIGSAAWRDPAVQVRVRGEPWKGDAAFAIAEAVFTALNGLIDETINSTRYMRVVAQTSGPVFLGYDKKNRPDFTISFRMKIQTGGA